MISGQSTASPEGREPAASHPLAATRVLLLTNSMANGGLERQLSLLARSLPHGFERRIWSMEGGPHSADVVAARVPLRVHERSFRFDVTPALDLWRVIASWRPHLVHAWHWMPSAAAIPACAALGVPLIDGSIRMGSVPHSLGRPRRSIMAGATLVVANSQAGLAAWRVGSRKGRVVYNAFDDTRLHSAVAAGIPVDAQRPFTVVMAARMDPPKDFETVLTAARYLSSRSAAPWRFVLLGDGRDRQALLARARDLMAAGVVAFPSAGTEVVGHLRDADVGVLMSDPRELAEGCPNSVMEYMACGLPVVCADSGGCRELVSDGETGFVVPPSDPQALVEKLVYLREHAEQARRLGSAGRARVVTEFTVDRMVQGFIRVYREAISRGRRVS